jgi:hypothetical protein
LAGSTKAADAAAARARVAWPPRGVANLLIKLAIDRALPIADFAGGAGV